MAPAVFVCPSGRRSAFGGPSVSVRDVSKRVRDGEKRRAILEGITFDIAPGELVVLQGPSGSGKTTLLGIVGAMLLPTSGEVLLDGEATSRLRDEHRSDRELEVLCAQALSQYSVRILDNVDLDRLPDLRARAVVIAKAMMERGDAQAFVLGRELLSRTERV